ncbi:transmembrane protein 225 isoform X2 [Pan troglodytes]|uniref:transmembrane protein 225 isoform X2 n=1 Tax=Pan troglodytes TaxID=9598 RepID=UPI0007DBB4B6|nr:transmembrane protein 225 isoform X2 [Pan troglodytes]
MVHVSNRSIQGMNILFSSWAIVLTMMGITLDKWVELISEDERAKMNHSPWMMCCPAFWPEDDLKVVRIMMMSSLGLSFLLNLILGMKFTYLIPQNKYIQLFTTILGFFSGIFLLWALILYHNKLKQGPSMHFSSYRITWIMYTAYLNVFFLSVCVPPRRVGDQAYVRCLLRLASEGSSPSPPFICLSHPPRFRAEITTKVMTKESSLS